LEKFVRRGGGLVGQPREARRVATAPEPTSGDKVLGGVVPAQNGALDSSARNPHGGAFWYRRGEYAEMRQTHDIIQAEIGRSGVARRKDNPIRP